MFQKNLTNSFFNEPYSSDHIAIRIKEVLKGKVGFYSVGLYPASLAYNCAMQNKSVNILLAPRSGRELFGAFSDNDLSQKNKEFKNKIQLMATARGNEYNAWPGGNPPNHTLILPFTRLLNAPMDFISLTGCISDGFISTFSTSSKIFAISVGLTEPYNSLFSVASFAT